MRAQTNSKTLTTSHKQEHSHDSIPLNEDSGTYT